MKTIKKSSTALGKIRFTGWRAILMLFLISSSSIINWTRDVTKLTTEKTREVFKAPQRFQQNNNNIGIRHKSKKYRRYQEGNQQKRKLSLTKKKLKKKWKKQRKRKEVEEKLELLPGDSQEADIEDKGHWQETSAEEQQKSGKVMRLEEKLMTIKGWTKLRDQVYYLTQNGLVRKDRLRPGKNQFRARR